MQLSRLVEVSRDVAGTRSRLRKRAYLSECLREARTDEVALIVDYLTGTLPQGRVGLGPAILRELEKHMKSRKSPRSSDLLRERQSIKLK